MHTNVKNDILGQPQEIDGFCSECMEAGEAVRMKLFQGAAPVCKAKYSDTFMYVDPRNGLAMCRQFANRKQHAHLQLAISADLPNHACCYFLVQDIRA